MASVCPGQIYRHFKGDEYVVLGIAVHTETSEDLVLYQRADGSDERVWARPIEMFKGLTTDGVSRFVLVG
jgi:hypothetical protein